MMEPLDWAGLKYMRRGPARRWAAGLDNGLLGRYATEWTGRVPWVCTQEAINERHRRGLA
jgi:hypothetical protein